MQQPPLGKAAKQLDCPVPDSLSMGLMSGCFVEGTLVVVGEEWVGVVLPVADDQLAQLVPTLFPEEEAADWDSLGLLLLVGSLGLTLAGWLLLNRRRPEKLPGTNDDWLNCQDDDADWEAMLADLAARDQLALQRGGA